MTRGILAIIFFLSGFKAAIAAADTTLADKLESKYFSTLDGWVARGGKASEYQSVVLETCGKLVMVTANASEAVALATTHSKEFDLRVDVCGKMTVHRTSHQPEFDDPKVIRALCEDDKVVLFRKLCKRSGLR